MQSIQLIRYQTNQLLLLFVSGYYIYAMYVYISLHKPNITKTLILSMKIQLEIKNFMNPTAQYFGEYVIQVLFVYSKNISLQKEG